MDSEPKKLLDHMSNVDEALVSDWSYNGVNTKRYSHGFHGYPARMIPQISNRLIVLFSSKGDVVWDPFCGSGSTLVESMILGRKSIGTDLNPFAIFLSKVKTRPIKIVRLEKTKNEIIERFHALSERKLEPEIPDMPNIEYWFKSNVIHDLGLLRESIIEIDDVYIREFCLMCFALTVREASNLRKNEFKIYRLPKEKLEDFNPKVFPLFLKNIDKNIQRMQEFLDVLPVNQEDPTILEDDNRDVNIAPNSVDLVVTSPPYGDHSTTVAYGQFSRYPALWVGLDLEGVKTVDRRGLGGRSTKQFKEGELKSKKLTETYMEIYEKSQKRAKEFYNFFFDLNESLQSIHEKLKPKASACIVIGNRLMSRVRIPTNDIITELGREIGLIHVKTISREIPTKRMPWQNAPENIEGARADTMHSENIVILEKR